MKDAKGHGSDARGAGQKPQQSPHAKAQAAKVRKNLKAFAHDVEEQQRQKHLAGLAKARAATSPKAAAQKNWEAAHPALTALSRGLHGGVDRYGANVATAATAGYRGADSHTAAVRSVGSGSSRSTNAPATFPSAHAPHVIGASGAHILSAASANRRSKKFAASR
jgi:hypothetical protein